MYSLEHAGLDELPHGGTQGQRHTVHRVTTQTECGGAAQTHYYTEHALWTAWWQRAYSHTQTAGVMRIAQHRIQMCIP